jgi:hypothetical protein
MKRIYALMIIAITLTSCGEDYLDKKSNKSLVIPRTLDDFQALLDNSQQVMNIVPGIGLIASDESFMEDAVLQALYTSTERNSYTWEKNVYQGEEVSDWNVLYQQVFYANVVLKGLEDITPTTTNQAKWNTVKGIALFSRAHAFHQLVEIFTSPYEQSTASQALGIPIRLSPDINAPVQRATLAESYETIIGDLKQAMTLLPTTAVSKTRPTTTTAKALLARIYLNMQQYAEAESYADLAWTENNYLLDYNDLDPASYAPIPFMNGETQYYATLITYSYVISTATYIDTLLLAKYQDGDLRKDLFFQYVADNRYFFKGSYTGSWQVFGGIANDEVLLIRAECRARNGNTSGALEDLNTLMEKRWKTGMFSPFTEAAQEPLLKLILDERQKELVFRNTRWSDLRRLNKEDRFAITLKRSVSGTLHTLPPNDLRYTFPIPDAEIRTTGMEQNPR